MNVDPLLKVLAAALAGDGPAVRLGPPTDGSSEPLVELLPDAGPLVRTDSPIAVVVSTSGSTGQPKQTQLSVDALAASSMGTAIALGGEGQWLLALPVHYVAGVQVLVRSLFAGTRPESVDTTNGFTAEAFTASALEMTDRIRYTSLVPTQLERLLADPTPETLGVLRRFQAVLLGGSPISEGLLDRARQAGVRVVTTYGSSETAGGCVYDGVPLEGVQVSLREGRIWLGGDTIASGYLKAPELTEQAFALEETEDGPLAWYRTDDEGEWAEDGTLRVLGRLDDVIITGGLKVSAQRVADRIRLVPGVRDAFVAGVDDPEWGQRVCAAVAGACSREELLAGLAGLLEAHAIPKSVLFVPEIPLLATGKPDRQLLQRLLAATDA
ncbi:MAG: AMP-dependent synthetase [Micrococcaceae bacterium]|nr:AMP-dependent synthetase [Micrococcaceae bacterium]